MDKVTAADLRELCDATGENLVSIYFSTERPGEQWTQNRLLLKNQLEAASRDLEERGQSARVVRQRLDPLAALVDDAEFWKSASDGFAAFIGSDETRVWRLPAAFADLLWIGPRYALKPLAPLASGGTYFALTASANGVEILRGDRWGMDRLPVELPPGLAEALDYEPVTGSIQVHSSQNAVHGKAGVFHGHGGAADAAKSDLENYFRLVDRALAPHLQGSSIPLVFVGVDYLFPIYQKANRYPYLLEERVTGNPSSFTKEELERRIRKAAEPAWAARRRLDEESFDRNVGAAKASSELEEIVAAADVGRVEAAFVALDVERWGKVDGPTVTRHARRQADSEDLLDRVVWATLRQGGRVYVEPVEELPHRHPAAALFRYAEAGVAERAGAPT